MKKTSGFKNNLYKFALLVLCFTASILTSAAQPGEKDAIDYYDDAKAIVDQIYKARTGIDIDSYAPIELRRQTFEVSFDATYSKKLDEAIALLNKVENMAGAQAAAEARNGNMSRGEKLKTTELEAKRYLALAYLEKAQYISNKTEDFASVITNLNEYITQNPYYDPNTGWRKDGYLISAELHALVAQNKIAQAMNIFRPWQRFVYPNINYEYIKKEIAVPSVADALDVTGNYTYTRGILLEMAYEQIRQDHGKFIPANHAITRKALQTHFRNLQYAYEIKETGKLLSLQIARHAGALSLANTAPSDAAKQFIMNAPDAIDKLQGQIVPIDTRLFAARLLLQSTKAGDNTKGWKLINDILKDDANNVAALAAHGYGNYLKADFTAAEADLSASIKANAFVAFFNDAYKTRALVYTKLGKADLAANDEKMAGGFTQMFGALGAP